MKRTLVVSIALAVVIAGSVGALALSRASDSGPSAVETAAPATASTTGVYVDYSDTAIADAQGRVVLFFHAPWCGQCRQLESDILSEGVPDGITIIKVDWDTHQDLEEKYGVPMRTTFVELDDNDQVVQRHVAYEEPRLSAVITAMDL
ncbi:hypothetical protein BH11ACT3_BH11ACT3_19090 [soil metagenome]